VQCCSPSIDKQTIHGYASSSQAVLPIAWLSKSLHGAAIAALLFSLMEEQVTTLLLVVLYILCTHILHLTISAATTAWSACCCACSDTMMNLAIATCRLLLTPLAVAHSSMHSELKINGIYYAGSAGLTHQSCFCMSLADWTPCDPLSRTRDSFIRAYAPAHDILFVQNSDEEDAGLSATNCGTLSLRRIWSRRSGTCCLSRCFQCYLSMTRQCVFCNAV